MRYSVIAICFLVGVAHIQGQCPPKESDVKMVTKYLENVLDDVKKSKPGTNPKDADFVINKVLKDVIHSKKWAPCNDNFHWSDVSKDAGEVRADCYKPSDYSMQAPQKAFMDCAKKHFPALVLKYGTPAIQACSCFGGTIAPNWETKYKKYAAAYVADYKTLKHRKK